jgi:hypothetical protein
MKNLGVLFLASLCGLGAHAVETTNFPKTMSQFESMSFAEMKNLPDIKIEPGKVLKSSDLEGKSETEMVLMRNSIYAQHGFRFGQKAVANYFLSRNWYKPTTDDYDFGAINKVEKDNAHLLMEQQLKIKGGREVAAEYSWYQTQAAYNLFLMGFCTYKVADDAKAGMIVFEAGGLAKVFHSAASRMSLEPYAYDQYLDPNTKELGQLLIEAKWTLTPEPGKPSVFDVDLTFPDAVYDQYTRDGKSILTKGVRRLLTIDTNSSGTNKALKNRTCAMRVLK